MTDLPDKTDPRIAEIAQRVQRRRDAAPNVSVQMKDGKAHPNYRHGLRTKEMTELRSLASLLSKKTREIVENCE